jgi:hypothetical protein
VNVSAAGAGASDTPAHYEIRLNGHLDPRWSEWFEGLTSTSLADGTTILSGRIADQAALHGLLRTIGDLGMTLVSVNVKANDPR